MKSAKSFTLKIKGKPVKFVEGQEIPKEYQDYIKKHKPDWVLGSKANKEGFRAKTEDEKAADAADAASEKRNAPGKKD